MTCEGQTQAEAILAELVIHHGEWVPMPRLAEVSGAYAVHSRISDLRGAGHDIQSKVEGVRPRKSFYRLVSPVQVALPLLQP
jgi:hypothetical protein